MNFTRLTSPRHGSAVALLVVLGAFLPWASFLGIGKSAQPPRENKPPKDRTGHKDV